MSKIILTRGLPGSGKTTWAKDKVWLDGGATVRLNRDDMRESLFGIVGVGTPEQENAITALQYEAARMAIREGKDVIVDAMNLDPRYNKPWGQFGVPVLYQDFPVPLGEVIARDSARGAAGGREVGVKVIAKIAKRYRIGDDGKLPEQTTVTPHAFWGKAPYSHAKSDAYIVDIDGTLADCEGVRSPYDESKVGEDRIHADVARVVGHLAHDNFIILVSGRHESCRRATEDWLLDNHVQYDELFMRADGDGRPDDLVKHEIFHNHIGHIWNVLGVFDDRARVLRMWRKIGLTTFAVGDTDNNNF